jgi:hypothetical protein
MQENSMSSNINVTTSATSSTGAGSYGHILEEKMQSESTSSHILQKTPCTITPIKRTEEIIPAITIDYFRKEIARDPHSISIAPTLVFLKHKWAYLREQIKKGKQELLFKETPPIKNTKTLIKLIQRSLIVLRLLPQPNNQTPPSFSFDITPLVTPAAYEALRKEFPLIEEKNRWIIPCQRKIEPHNKDEKDLSLYSKMIRWIIEKPLSPSSKMIRAAIDVLPNDIQGEIMSYLQPHRIQALLPYSANPAFAQRLSKQFDKLVQSTVREALSNYKENQILSFSEDIELIRLYVRKLDLSELELSPDAIIQLALYFPNIKELNLSKCGNIDNVIYRLRYFSQLESLNLNGSDATGIGFYTLPKSLKKLGCSNWRLRDDVVRDLTHLTALEELSFGQTYMLGLNFDELPKSLKTLDCSWCLYIGDGAISKLSHCKNLSKLILNKTSVQGRCFETLPPSLKILECNMCPLEDDAILKLSHCHDLTTVSADSTHITGKYFSHLSKSLQQLTCQECPITDEAILDLSHCDQLIELKTDGTSITGKYFHMLPKSLKIANFSHSKITDEAILQLQGCTSLEELSIDGTSIQGTHLDSLPGSLRRLHCWNCPQLKKEVKGKLKKSRPYLHLSLGPIN